MSGVAQTASAMEEVNVLPEIVIGPILIISGVLIHVLRQGLPSAMHRGLERLMPGGWRWVRLR